MEESKGLVSGMDGAAASSLTPHLGELLAVALRLTEDADFKIVRETFQEIYFCVDTFDWYLRRVVLGSAGRCVH